MLCTKLIKLTLAFVTQIGAMLLVSVDGLYWDTLKLPEAVAIQLPTPTLYINVFVLIAAKEGVIKPVVALIKPTATLVLNVPPEWLTVIVTADALVQKGFIGVIVGVTGFATVTVNVFVTGQFINVGVTTTE